MERKKGPNIHTGERKKSLCGKVIILPPLGGSQKRKQPQQSTQRKVNKKGKGPEKKEILVPRRKRDGSSYLITCSHQIEPSEEQAEFVA